MYERSKNKSFLLSALCLHSVSYAYGSLSVDGMVTIYAGCHQINSTNSGMLNYPPFQPMSKIGAMLSLPDKLVQDLISKSCAP